MAGPYGLTAAGFAIKPRSQILTDMQAVQLAEIDPNLDLNPPDPFAVLTGNVADMLGELWEVAGALYSGMDPDVASDDQLTGLALITGTERLGPQPTEVPGCTVNVGAGFSAAAHTMYANPVGNTDAKFWNKTAVSNPGGSAANLTVDFEAVDDGPTQVLAGTLTQIAQSLNGWNSITNPNAGTPGSDIEDDPDLRLRRDEELAATGTTTAAAIRADVLSKMVPPTVSSETLACTVLYNDTDLVDANGLPPHSVEVIAYQPGATGADNIALANLILADKAAGIDSYGLTSATGTDSAGHTEVIKFTRPVTIPVYVAITVKTDPSKFPAGAAGIAAVQAALTSYASGEWQPGVSVYLKATQSAVFPSPIDALVGVPGVLDVTDFRIDTVYPAVATATINVDQRHIAVISTINVTVT
jgi:uncharacterized phage protein gp47/JayE